jgi:hypothetical protein
VDLPEGYKGESWLKPVEETEEIPTLSSKAEVTVTPENPVKINKEEKKARRKAKQEF